MRAAKDWHKYAAQCPRCGGVKAHPAKVCGKCRYDVPMLLRLGTSADNTRDAVKKGRLGAGLSLEIARRIRTLRASGIAQSVLAREYKVAQSMVSRICSGEYWREVTVRE